MKLDSRLSKEDYLYYLRQNARLRLCDSGERFSGFVVGNFFLLRYYSYNAGEKQRLNRAKLRSAKITYNAFGFVNTGDYGTEVLFLYTAGYLDPFSFLVLILIGFVASINGFLPEEPVVASLVVVFISALVIGITAIISSSASCAERGRRIVLKFLEDPSKVVSS